MRCFFISCLILLLSACTTPENRALRLRDVETLFVLLDPASINSLNNALSPSLSNYGAVNASDFKPVLKGVDIIINGSEVFGAAAYIDADAIPDGSLYMPVRPNDLFKYVEAQNFNGISIAAGRGADDFVISREEIHESMQSIPIRDPLALEIFEKK